MKLVPSAAVIVALLAAVTCFHHDRGSLVARLLLGLACAAVLLLGVFAAPAVRDAKPFAVDGSSRWHQAKQVQLWAAGISTSAAMFIFNPGIAVMVGILVAVGVGAARGGAESRGE